MITSPLPGMEHPIGDFSSAENDVPGFVEHVFVWIVSIFVDFVDFLNHSEQDAKRKRRMRLSL